MPERVPPLPLFDCAICQVSVLRTAFHRDVSFSESFPWFILRFIQNKCQKAADLTKKRFSFWNFSFLTGSSETNRAWIFHVLMSVMCCHFFASLSTPSLIVFGCTHVIHFFWNGASKSVLWVTFGLLIASSMKAFRSWRRIDNYVLTSFCIFLMFYNSHPCFTLLCYSLRISRFCFYSQYRIEVISLAIIFILHCNML